MAMRLVFDRGSGTWLEPAIVQRAFRRSVKRAQLPSLTPHGMRHSMATIMLAAGVHPKVVQERLGHKSIQMTLDLYSHVSMTMQQDAAAFIDQLLAPEARPNRGHDAG
jgi:integrase